MSRLLKRLWQDELGASLQEYALVIVLIGLGVVASTQNFATSIANATNSVASAFGQSSGGGPVGGGGGGQQGSQQDDNSSNRIKSKVKLP
jgi:Flp pilus assembly pilin Flp